MAERFKALEDFECDITQSHYGKDLVYTIREGNSALAERVKQWRDEGKVEMLVPGAATAMIQGKANVVPKK